MMIQKLALVVAIAFTLSGCLSGGDDAPASTPDTGNGLPDETPVGGDEETPAPGQGEGGIQVLSNRPDLISGGSALVAVESSSINGAQYRLNGEEVPFIVRVETGVLNRDRYQIKTLYQPEEDWSALAPQPQWNGKLLIHHGGNVGVIYAMGTPPNGDISGAINTAEDLHNVPIIDLRGPDPGIAHDAFHSWQMRARLEETQAMRTTT